MTPASTKWNGLNRSRIKPAPDALPLSRYVQIRRESPKRKAANAVRRRVLAEMRQADPMCARCRVAPWVDGNELLRRSAAGSITNPDNIIGVCRPCHDWIGANPRQAIAEGFARSRYEPNVSN